MGKEGKLKKCYGKRKLTGEERDYGKEYDKKRTRKVRSTRRARREYKESEKEEKESTKE